MPAINLDDCSSSSSGSDIENDLNIFAITFEGMKDAEKNLAGGDAYECKNCKAILNRYSKVISAK